MGPERAVRPRRARARVVGLLAGACVAASVGGAVLWSGTAETVPTQWSVTSSPSLGTDAVLSGVSCASPTFCAAVGDDYVLTVTELWDATSWRTVPSPSPGSLSNRLHGVSCTGPDFWRGHLPVRR